jgi:hypothetical protein
VHYLFVKNEKSRHWAKKLKKVMHAPDVTVEHGPVGVDEVVVMLQPEKNQC